MFPVLSGLHEKLGCETTKKPEILSPLHYSKDRLMIA
jgi:hypothetical protein